MKKFMIITFLTADVLSLAALSQVHAATQSYGSARYEKQNLTDVEVYGSASFDGSTVTGKATIYGSLNARDAKFKALEVNGSCKAKDSHIHDAEVNGSANFEKVTADGKIEINGSLTAKNSTFKGPLSIAARKATLEKSTAKSIEMGVSDNLDEKKGEILVLKDSIIEGNVKFLGGHGKVIALRGSKVKGKVEGGQLIEK